MTAQHNQGREGAKALAGGFGVIALCGLALNVVGYDPFGSRVAAIMQLWWVFAIISVGAGIYYLAE